MNNPFHLIAIGGILGTLLLGSSCSKKQQETPTPTAETLTGPSITGLIQPADAINGVSLVDKTTHQPIAGAALDSKGAYHFNTVFAGTYDLFFDSKYGYVRPRQLIVTVASGKTTLVPTVTVVKSTASLTVSGTAFNPALVYLSISFDGKNLLLPRLFSVVLSDGNMGIRGPGYRLYLTMPYAVTTGTYRLNDPSTYAIFQDVSGEIFDSSLNPTTVLSNGKLVITDVKNITPFPRSVSGTFSFTGTSTTLGTQKTFIGTFENAYF